MNKTIENFPSIFNETSSKEFDRHEFLAAQHWKNTDTLFSEVLNSKWYRTIGRILAEIQRSTSLFYDSLHFHQIPLPITCSSISSPFGLGSDSEPVQIELFKQPVFLADSMQFHLEYILRQGYKGVYYIMPTFRGEDPDRRHLNQFFHSELEMEGTLEDVIQVIEGYLHYCTTAIYDKYSQSIRELKGGVSHIEKFLMGQRKIPRIAFEDTVDILPSESRFYKFLEGEKVSLTQEGEKYLINHFGGPVWLLYHPIKSVPFYQAWKSDGKHAYCADLLMGIGEVIGCGQRHTTFEETEIALTHHNVCPQDYLWYLRMKKDYPVLTSGFGMGIERYILWLLNHDDIRDIPLFNRIKGTISFP